MTVNGAISLWGGIAMGPGVLMEIVREGIPILVSDEGRLDRRIDVFLNKADILDPGLKLSLLQSFREPRDGPSLGIFRFAERTRSIPRKKYAKMVANAALSRPNTRVKENAIGISCIFPGNRLLEGAATVVSSNIIHDLYEVATGPAPKLAKGAITQLIEEAIERWDGLAAGLLLTVAVGHKDRFTDEHENRVDEALAEGESLPLHIRNALFDLVDCLSWFNIKSIYGTVDSVVSLLSPFSTPWPRKEFLRILFEIADNNKKSKFLSRIAIDSLMHQVVAGSGYYADAKLSDLADENPGCFLEVHRRRMRTSRDEKLLSILNILEVLEPQVADT